MVSSNNDYDSADQYCKALFGKTTKLIVIQNAKI